MSDYTNLDKNTTLKELTYEIWKRILNNLPYLYKTKGTKRGLQALITCYGIPSSILKIIEYGGPNISSDNITEYTFDNFSYSLNFSGSLVSIPWTSSQGEFPQSIQFRFLTSAIPNNSMSLVQVDDNSQLNWGLEVIPTTLDKGKINFKILSNTNTYSSISSSELPIFDGNFNSITLQRTSASDSAVDQTYELYIKKYVYEQILYSDSKTLNITATSGNLGWVVTSSNFYIGGHNYLADSLVASFDELRFWNCNLEEKIINKHVKHPTSIIGNTITGSYDDLVLRISFDDPTNHYGAGSGSLKNVAPSKIYPTSSMQIYGFANQLNFPYNYTGYNYFSTVNFSNIGGQRWSNKIRIESASLNGNLQYNKRVEVNEYDLANIDSNKLGIYFSPITPVNENIIEFLGLENIGDLIGSPIDMYSGSYSNLDTLNKLYWTLTDRKISINDYLSYIRKYDKSLFDNIKQFIPARTKPILGLVYEPHILERNKIVYKKPIIEDLTKDALITSSVNFVSDTNNLNDTIDLYNDINLITNISNDEGIYDIYDLINITTQTDNLNKILNINDEYNNIETDYTNLNKTIEINNFYNITSSNFEKSNIYNILIDLNSLYFESNNNEYTSYEQDISVNRLLNVGFPDYQTINRQDLYRMSKGLQFFDYYTETRLTSSVFQMIIPYVNFERENNILESTGFTGFCSNIYQIYDYKGTHTGSFGAVPSGSGYSKYHYKWKNNFSTSDKRLKYVGCKNTINTTYDLKEPIETWYSNPNEITSDDINNSYVSVV